MSLRQTTINNIVCRIAIVLTLAIPGITCSMQEASANGVAHPYIWLTPARVGAWGVNDTGNNYYYGFMFSWTAALAAQNDDSRAANHLVLMMNKYRNEVRPFLDGLATGGLFAESTNYDSIHYLARILDS